MDSEALVRDKVQRILVDAAGEITLDSDGDFAVEIDGVQVSIRVEPRSEHLTLVNIFATVLWDVVLTDELCRWAATDGQQFIFGSAMVVADDEASSATGSDRGELLLVHTMIGDYLDPDELTTVVFVLGMAVNDVAKSLHSRFGGKIASDD